MNRAAELLSELVAIPTHQAGPDGKGGDERRLCEHLAPMLRARGADEVIVGNAAAGGDRHWIQNTLAQLNGGRSGDAAFGPVRASPLRPTPETAKLAYLMLANLGA